MKRRLWLAAALAALAGAALAAALTSGSGPRAASAASHREAPLISLDGPADITDFFLFRSYEPGKQNNVVMLMDTQSEEPSSGPNYWNFDPSVLYTFNVDSDRDGKADDVKFEFRFRNEPIRGTAAALTLFQPYVAIPPITSLDGAGSDGLGFRQRYSVTMVKGTNRTVLADNLIAVPSNVGPRTMPNYESLAAQGTYTLPGGVRVFAGQRQDPFYIDLGGIFDTVNLRRAVPALTPAEDANDAVNPFGTDMLSGFNVHTIALELPSAMLTGDTGTTTIGAYAATSRPRITVNGKAAGPLFRQVQRLANPLVNEVIIGTQDKDRWNATEPEDEAQFLDYYRNPRLATALKVLFPFLNVPATPREDLKNILLQYTPQDQRLSELLRLNLNVAPTPLAMQKRLTVLAGDNAGWPNGRRPKDDVTDVAIRVVGGTDYINNRVGDGVNVDDAALQATFPYLATPASGRDRQHDNP
jgi:Domain of unknown function (DUF4331)